ncbi:MAG: Trm112 family protein [Chthoniobacterales bacterium]
MDSPTDMDWLLEVVRCPRTGQRLVMREGKLVTEDGGLAYRMEDGIPVLLAEEAEEMAR